MTCAINCYPHGTKSSCKTLTTNIDTPITPNDNKYIYFLIRFAQPKINYLSPIQSYGTLYTLGQETTKSNIGYGSSHCYTIELQLNRNTLLVVHVLKWLFGAVMIVFVFFLIGLLVHLVPL